MKGGSVIIDDRTIISLLFDRNEQGLSAVRAQYGSYMQSILYNILRNNEDTEECLNDALLAVWNSIPPANPDSLKSFLGAVTRNIGINCYSKKNRIKRRGETEELLEELVSTAGDGDPEGELMAKQLQKTVNDFLSSLDEGTRVCFVLRYYYANTNEEIAEKTGKTVHGVAALLSKTRARLKKYLEEQGTQV